MKKIFQKLNDVQKLLENQNKKYEKMEENIIEIKKEILFSKQTEESIEVIFNL